jgi:hydrogenase maturation protease
LGAYESGAGDAGFGRSQILVAGIGNIFMGDDGFGVAVARRLRERGACEGAAIADFGIRGFDLAFALIDGCRAAILVDALQRGEAPGTLCVLEPEIAELKDFAPPNLEGHDLHPAKVLQLAQLYGSLPERILVVGCEPANIEFAVDGEMGLSTPVQASVDEAAGLVESLVQALTEELEHAAVATAGEDAPRNRASNA